jgi:hypothetical protein
MSTEIISEATMILPFVLVVFLYKEKKDKSVFDSVVMSAFQITFRAKMHVNDFFSFFKIYF